MKLKIFAIIILGVLALILSLFISQIETGVVQVPSVLEVSVNTASIGVNQTVRIQGIDITVHNVVGDYRCPIDALCIEGGAITAHVTFSQGDNTKTLNMASDEVPQEFAGRKISIIDVFPPRISTQEPDPLAYTIMFQVDNY